MAAPLTALLRPPISRLGSTLCRKQHESAIDALVIVTDLYTSKLLCDFMGRSEARAFTDGADDRPAPGGMHV